MIEQILRTKTVRSFCINEDRAYELLFDTGCEYLDNLKVRIKHHAVFSAQFGSILHILLYTPEETFRKITVSPVFWIWWATQVWRVCNHCLLNDIIYRQGVEKMLCTSEALIPELIIEKIFGYEKEKNAKKNRKANGYGFLEMRVKQVC
jgi:hypothetical protein